MAPRWREWPNGGGVLPATNRVVPVCFGSASASGGGWELRPPPFPTRCPSSGPQACIDLRGMGSHHLPSALNVHFAVPLRCPVPICKPEWCGSLGIALGGPAWGLVPWTRGQPFSGLRVAASICVETVAAAATEPQHRSFVSRAVSMLAQLPDPHPDPKSAACRGRSGANRCGVILTGAACTTAECVTAP